MRSLRDFARLLRHTPIHPQWLLGAREIPASLKQAAGIVLDIGAADRWIARHLPDSVTYLALDYPATGNEFYAARPDIFADACYLPIADRSVDGVVCLEVVEHVPDPALAFQEISRVLKPGGCAWISMPFLYPVHNEPFDFQRYTEFGLRRDVTRAKLDIVDLHRSGHAISTAGLILCLAIAGGVHARRGVLKLFLLPIALLLILTINLLSGLLSQLWPDWSNVSMGHHLVLRKPIETITEPDTMVDLERRRA